MRVLPALALTSALLLGACTNPDGSLNVPATLALGAGAAIAGVAIASANDGPRYHNHGYYRRPSYGYGRPAYASGYGYRGGYRGYGYRPYRGW
jgi:hypothetical protein